MFGDTGNDRDDRVSEDSAGVEILNFRNHGAP